ncbi:MAG: carboxypeptidase-like regulatory domain-containing protein [Jatrophihabitantaceae bacterium]
MRVLVSPQQAAVVPGQMQPISITITNTSTVIGGYTVRLLGADPGWVELDTDQVSLFPDETRTLLAKLTAPHGIPAGSRRIAVQVRELTPPEATSITEIDLTVPAARSVQMRADPLAVTAGKRASFSLIVENTGNTVVAADLAGDDPEKQVEFGFEPEHINLSPGEHAVIDMRAKARRHFTGSPTIRQLGLYLDDLPADGFFAEPSLTKPAARTDREALANATFIQKAVLSRGPLSLLGLLAAVTVFAIVIVFALSRLVGQSTADRNLALQVAAARNSSATIGTSGVAGTVRLLTSGKAVPGVAVSLFDASDTSTPIATTATDAKGAYSVGNLAAGKYKLSFRGAGFVQLWYPGAATDADATTVTLAAGQQQAGLDVSLGGVPASISGTVVGDDVSNATLYLETSPAGAGGTSTAAVTTGLVTPGVNTPPNNGNAVVKTVPIGSDGTFALTNVPSPSIYQLVVTKAGYATSTQSIDIGAGENRTGLQITLTKGDGIISGTVSSPTGPLPGSTVTATAGQSTSNTVSLTGAQAGAFTLRGLPTPATFTVTASAPGFATQTLSLTLAAGQKLTGVTITLGTSAGSLAGLVTQQPANVGAGGVSVTVTDGLLTIQTVTESRDHVGAWEVDGLPVPSTYTVTFARSDLASQTVSVSLDSSGNITSGSQGARITSAGIAVAMQSSTATVYGKITQPGGDTVCDSGNGLGEAQVTLNSGASSYTVVSASVPSGSCGQYRIEQVPPGTYTLTVTAGSGTSPSSRVITLNAGDVSGQAVNLAQPASMTGVVQQDGANLCGWTVFLYKSAQYPVVTTQVTQSCGSSAPTGSFRFNDIAAGKYIVAAGPTSDPANATTTKQVTVQPSQQLTGVTIEVPTS